MRGHGGRLAFFGFFGIENYGNQASLACAIMLARAQQPGLDLACVCVNPDIVASEHGVEGVSLYHPGVPERLVPSSRLGRVALLPVLEVLRWVGAFRYARRFSAVVVPGTGLLDDFGLRPYPLPWTLLRWTIVCRLARTPIILLSIGAGPIERSANRRLMLPLARHATLRTYRDEVSADYMAEHGAPGRVTPDIVFGRRHEAAPRGDRPRPVVGLGVMAYYGWANDDVTGMGVFDAHVAKAAELATRLVTNGDDVVLLTGESSDDRAVAAVLRQLTPDVARHVTAPAIRSFDDVIAETAATDAAIVTRYHGLVAALLTARPTVSVEYAKKNTDLMRSVGLGEFNHRIDGYSVDAVLDDLARVRRDWPTLEPRVRKTVDGWESDVAALVREALAPVLR